MQTVNTDNARLFNRKLRCKVLEYADKYAQRARNIGYVGNNMPKKQP